MKTLIFGGSFDPIHNGHLKIASETKNYLNADKVLFLIAKSPRWKECNATDEDRLNMLKLALSKYEGFEISYLELDSNDEVNYTYETLKKYHRDENEEVYFLFGADQEEKLHLWHHIDDLSKLVKLVCFKRPGYKINKENIEKYHVTLIDVEVSNMSSSSLRSLEDLDAPKEVLSYISSHGLYYIKDIKKYISNKRFLHSVSVAETAYDIALNNGVDPSKAYVAGLLHDIAKEIPLEEHIRYIKENIGESYLSIQKPLYHQFTGVKIAREVFGIKDEEILEAIKVHATGSGMMSKMAKILYAADKIEPTRGYDSSELINECIKDIDTGFVKVLDENVKFFIEKGIKYDNPLTLECIKTYLKKGE